jgi:cytochrome c-type biogenesis protein CcmH/NrfG
VGKFEEYVESRNHQIRQKQKIIVMVSVISFFGSSALTAIELWRGTFQQPAPSLAASAKSSLQQEEQQYKLALKQEPTNQAALEGLVNTRLQMGDNEKAIKSLEQLVKLYPGNKDYTLKLNQIKAKTAQS